MAAAAERTTLPLPRLFVVPGSRFREIYYWDYWVVLGLLAVDMRETARDVTANLHLAAAHGFVPNGARAYYLNRRSRRCSRRWCTPSSSAASTERRRRPPPAACTAAAGAAAGRGPLAAAPPAALEAAEAAAQAEFLRDALPVPMPSTAGGCEAATTRRRCGCRA